MLTPLILILAALFFIGCGSNPPAIGERNKIDVSGSQPNWVKKMQDSWEDKENMYFRVMLTDQADLSMGMEALKAKGIREVAEKVSMRISTDLGYTERGSSSAGGTASRFLNAATAAQTNQLELSGFKTEESYWERYAVNTHNGISYVYDIYRNFSIKKSDYVQAKAMVLAKAQELANREQEKKAEEGSSTILERNME